MTKEVLKYLIRVLKSKFATKEEIPTKTSDLTNDNGFLSSVPEEYVTETELSAKGYLTEHQDISGKANKSDIPTKTSQLTNDSNFISSVPSEYVTETELNAKGYTTETFVTEAINNVEASSHTHSNKELLDTITADNVHEHINKDVIDAITSDMTTKWNKGIPFEDSYTSDCNTWLTNGYTKTSTSTANHPSVCTGADRWGVLFYISENATNGTGTQMYFPIDGTYAGRVFTRKILSRNAGEWNLLSTFDGNYDNLTNKPTIPTVPTNVSQLTNDIGYITSIPSEYITEEELESKGYLTSVPNEYVTETKLESKGYLTEHQDVSNKADKSEIPTKTSQLTNDSNFISSIPSEYITETELNEKGYLTEHQDISGKADTGHTHDDRYYTETEINTKLSGKADKSEIPTKVSQLTNDSNFAVQPNFTFEINMIASTEQPNVVTNGTYPNLVVTFNIPQGTSSDESGKPIYYGRLSITEVGGSVVQYNSITDAMIKNGTNITKITSQTLDRISVGKQSETSKGDYIIVAVPNDEGYIVKKDNGLGGKIAFDKDVAGANGVILNIDGNEYAIYGEILISPAEIFIYINKN